MSTTKEQLLLRALSEYSKTHTSFRNRHMAQLSGLDRQDVNYYLNKWQSKGFVSKNPLVSGEWILIDLQGLVADIVEPTEPTKMGHAKHELFDTELLGRLHMLTEVYAALKALKAPNLVNAKDQLERYINDAIHELRNERTFMHVKQYSKERARKIVLEYPGAVKALGVDPDKLVDPNEKPMLTLAADRKES